MHRATRIDQFLFRDGVSFYHNYFARSDGQHILPADLPPVRADKARVQQILSNLLSNGHKYSPAGARLTLTAERAGSYVRVSVRDTGYGIGPADQAKLFSQFFRSDDANIREQTGWGLGLHVTKLLVELQGGQMTVQSEPGQGSTFTFTLPLLPSA